MKRKLAIFTGLTLLVGALVGVAAAAGLPLKGHQYQMVDEWGRDVNLTTSASITVYEAGGTTAQTIYRDGGGGMAMTNPVLDDSTNTGLVYNRGLIRYFSKTNSAKLKVTDGSNTVIYDNLTTSDGRLLWPTSLSNPAPQGILAPVTVITASTDVSNAMLGGYIISKGAGTAAQIDVNLPTAAVGKMVIVSDANATAADDVWINAGTGDTVNGGTAGKSIKCVTDAVGQTICLLAIDDTRWIILWSVGTWANDNT